jgi:adenosine deaminase
MTSDDFAQALRALPKVELHCHVEGTMRPGTVVDLARKNAVPLPASDSDRDDWARLGYHRS